MTIPITPELRAAHEANRAAVLAATHRAQAVLHMRRVFATQHHGRGPFGDVSDEASEDFARIAADMLSNEQRLSLVIHLTDNLEGFDDDARNDAVDALGRMA